MKRHQFLAVITCCFLTLFGSVASSADSGATEVEAVIGKFFKAFHAKKVEGMAAVSAPTAKIVDYGQSFTLDEWKWFMQFQFDNGSTFDVKLADFNTKIQGDLAYTAFRMGDEKALFEVANAVLKRIDGEWRIAFLSIEKQQNWLPWLRDRIKKGQDISNWYAEYVKQNPY